MTFCEISRAVKLESTSNQFKSLILFTKLPFPAPGPVLCITVYKHFFLSFKLLRGSSPHSHSISQVLSAVPSLLTHCVCFIHFSHRQGLCASLAYESLPLTSLGNLSELCNHRDLLAAPQISCFCLFDTSCLHPGPVSHESPQAFCYFFFLVYNTR